MSANIGYLEGAIGQGNEAWVRLNS